MSLSSYREIVVPPQLPERYEAQIRLGRDEDIEEWLAVDVVLDRPVLVRILGPEASPERRGRFLGSARAAAGASHIHLARVFAVGSTDSGAFAVLEWNGGVSVADRLLARETIPVEDFLPNAAGLAGGLAALHESGATHGAIDTGAIQFSAAHPAKLAAFGREPRTSSRQEDTAALARSLRVAITGSEDGGVRPSQVAEGLPRIVDEALDQAEKAGLDAESLGSALRAAPFDPPRPSQPGWSWRWLLPASLLLLAAILIAAAGLSLETDPDSPFLFPATPPPPPAQPALTETTVVRPPPPPPTPSTDGALNAQVAVYDPLGDNKERDADLAALLDGNPSTSWRTERYFAPLSQVKDGVGLTFRVAGAPGQLVMAASQGTRYRIGWADPVPDSVDSWEFTGSGTVPGGSALIQLPTREEGIWLVWFTELPEQPDGEYYTVLTEVRFLP